MNKYYVGQLSRAVTHFNHTDKPAKVELAFDNGDFSEEMPFKLDHEYYVVEKSELDAYIARKEHLEQMNCIPVFGENQRLKAKVSVVEAENAKLVEENEALVERNTKLKVRLNKFYGMTSAGEELRAANEKLRAEIYDLNERISHLEIIQRLLAKENTSLMCENGKLRGTKNELDATVAKLRQELNKFNGEHTVEFLYEKHEDGKHIIGWTEVSGEEYELTFLTPERTIHE